MNVKVLAIVLAIIIGSIGIIIDRNTKPSNVVPVTTQEIDTTQYEAVPDFSFTRLDGKKFELAEMKEPVLLVHFWASWCGVCKVEFPELLKMVSELDGKVALLSISIDDKKASMEKFIGTLEGDDKSNPHTYWIWDETKDLSLNVFHSMKTPETIVVGPDRKMIRKIAGKTDWVDNAKSFEMLIKE